jgi:MarR family transcriptional regulator, 2-MHQ and catechol-resistance regulon repressor
MATIEKEIRSKFTSEQQKAMLNVIFTGNWLVHRHGNFLKPFGISPQQYNMLRILRGKGEKMPMNDLKSRMLDKTPNVTRLSDKLEEKKLISRKRCEEDRRVIYLEITAKGLAYLKDMDEKWAMMPIPENNLSVEEAQNLNTLLDKIRD